MLVDSHCHLDYFSGELNDVLARTAAAGVGQVLTISTRVREQATYRAIAEAHPGVFFSVGTHPMQAKDEPDVTREEIIRAASPLARPASTISTSATAPMYSGRCFCGTSRRRAPPACRSSSIPATPTTT